MTKDFRAENARAFAQALRNVSAARLGLSRELLEEFSELHSRSWWNRVLENQFRDGLFANSNAPTYLDDFDSSVPYPRADCGQADRKSVGRLSQRKKPSVADTFPREPR